MTETDYRIIIGQKIRTIRNSLGLTQEAFCNAINLENSNLSNIENGKSLPSIQTIFKIINVFKIEPNELFDTKFYANSEIVDKLMLDYYNLLPFSKKLLALKIIMMVNEEDKNKLL